MISFLTVCFFLTITPGSDTALILRSSLNSGKLSVFATTIGICAGLLVHATLSAFGFAAILQSSPKVFEFIQIVGAGYLIYLGYTSIHGALKNISLPNDSNHSSSDTEKTSMRFAENFKVGFLTNILNPKVALFYFTFLPQFMSPSDHAVFKSFLLAGIHILMSFVWLNLIGLFIISFQKCLLNLKFKKYLEILTGLILILFGIWMIRNF